MDGLSIDTAMHTRAAVCWEVGTPWDVVEVELAAPGPGEILVKLEFAGLCHTDDHTPSGDFPSAVPMVGGHEGAGEVLATGPGVSRLSVGDAVIVSPTPTCGVCPSCANGQSYLCDSNAAVMRGARDDGSYPFRALDGRGVGAYAQLGTFAEHTVVRESQAIRYERDIPAASAALVSCAIATGYGSAVRVAEVRDGDTVVVVGAGGVGVGAIQGARIAGAAAIVVVDPVLFKRQQATRFGATHTAATIDEARDLIAEHSRGRMAESAIITVGILRGDMIGPVASLVGKGGTIVVTSAPRFDETSITLPIADTFFSGKRIVGSVMGNIRPFVDYDTIFALYRSGALLIDEMVTRTYPLTDINLGYTDMKAGINIRGVIRF